MSDTKKVYVSDGTSDGVQVKLAPSEHYGLKTKDIRFPGPEILSEDKKFFDRASVPHPENLPDLGKSTTLPVTANAENKDCWQKLKENILTEVVLWGSSKKKLTKTPNREDSEVLAARDRRVRDFQANALKVIKVDPADVASHQLSEIIDIDKEEIVQILKCSEVEGLPSSTDKVHVVGSVEVALVRNRAKNAPPSAPPLLTEQVGEFGTKHQMALDDGAGAKLIFSMCDGTMEFGMNEQFFHFAVCYCISPTCCDCCLSMGSTLMDYRMQSDVSRQFCTMPLRNTVIDCVATRRTDRRYWAGTAANANNRCAITCINCLFLYKFCFSCCGFCDNCKCPKCNELFLTSFGYSEKHELGQKPPLEVLGTKDVNGLEMMIITSGTDDIVVEMQYKSPLNGKIRRCTMTVSRDYKEPYLDARKFVVNVLNSRGPAFGHEPVTVAAASLTNRRSTGLLHEIINFLLGKSTKN